MVGTLTYVMQPEEINCGSIQHQTDIKAVRSDLAKMQVEGDSESNSRRADIWLQISTSRGMKANVTTELDDADAYNS